MARTEVAAKNKIPAENNSIKLGSYGNLIFTVILHTLWLLFYQKLIPNSSTQSPKTPENLIFVGNQADGEESCLTFIKNLKYCQELIAFSSGNRDFENTF